MGSSGAGGRKDRLGIHRTYIHTRRVVARGSLDFVHSELDALLQVRNGGLMDTADHLARVFGLCSNIPGMRFA